MKIRITVDVDVDLNAWMTSYGQNRGEAIADMVEYLPSITSEKLHDYGQAAGNGVVPSAAYATVVPS